MILMKDYLETIDYKVTSGSKYLWKCYGPNAFGLDCEFPSCYPFRFSCSIIFDTKTHDVYEASVHDYIKDNSYRLINPEYLQAFTEEAIKHNVDPNLAWDDHKFIDLNSDAEWLDKARAIVRDQPYDR